MIETITETIDVLKMGQNGQVTVPIDFRKGHALTKGARLTSVQMGDALILIPQDEILDSICARMIAAMKAAGLTVEDMKAGVLEERANIVRERYGYLLDEDEANQPSKNLPG